MNENEKLDESDLPRPPGPIPLLTADLPGCGGRMVELEDFVVDEVPAYLPCGAGEHCMARVRKRGLTTPQAIQAICGALGLDPGAAGSAGLKDRQGVTTQWLSFFGARPEPLLSLQHPDLEVLEAALHGNKLRTGHLRGNRFEVVLRGVVPDGEARARAILERVASQGLPNFFGEQRFGRDGDNAQQGLALLRGERRPPKSRGLFRLLLSAVQSGLFNRVLALRLEQGVQRRLLGGEVLQRIDSGGMFVSEDAALDGERLARGELTVTGPIYGPRMPWPAEQTPARELEARVLEEAGLTTGDFGRMGRLARGGRRPLTVTPDSMEVEALTLDARPGLRLRFTLPPGSYATVLLQEVVKQDLRVEST